MGPRGAQAEARLGVGAQNRLCGPASNAHAERASKSVRDNRRRNNFPAPARETERPAARLLASGLLLRLERWGDFRRPRSWCEPANRWRPPAPSTADWRAADANPTALGGRPATRVGARGLRLGRRAGSPRLSAVAAGAS